MVLPFENDNNKIIKKLAKRSFQTSPLRNLVAVLAIALTGILFTSVTTIGIGAMQTLKQSAQIQKMSKADAEIRNMTKEEFAELKKSEMVSKAGKRMPVGYLTNTMRHNVELNFMDAIEQELTFNVPTNGTAPTKGMEVMTSVRALKELGVEPEIGARVPIAFTVRGKEYQFDMTLSGWWESRNDQVSIMVLSEAFVVANPDIFTNTYRQDNEVAGTYFSDVMMKSKVDMQAQLDSFARRAGGEPTDMDAPNFLPTAVNQQTNPQLSNEVKLIMVLAVALFIFCGYLLIYNVFDIAVMQEIKRYGLYRTVGMSRKQVKKLINLQALWLTGIGIPIGLLTGFFTGRAALPKVMEILQTEYKNLAIEVMPNPIIFVGAALLTALTVYISTRKPARIASRISPIEALRYIEHGTGKRKVKKRLRGASVGRMAFENIGRNKRRTAFIILSMMLCMILVNSAYIIAGSVDIDKMVRDNARYDFTVTTPNTLSVVDGFWQQKDSLAQSVIQDLKEQIPMENENITYKNTVEDSSVSFDFGQEISEKDGNFGTVVSNDGIPLRFVLADDGYPMCNVYGIGDAGLSHMEIVEGEKNPEILAEKLRNGEGVIIGVPTDLADHALVPFLDFCEVGQTITVRVGGAVYKTYPIIAKAALVTDEQGAASVQTGNSKVGGDAACFFFQHAEYENIYQSPAIMKFSFDVKEGTEEKTEVLLKKYVDNSSIPINYSSVLKARGNAQALQNTYLVVGGLIGIIIGSAGVLNLINMLITSVLSRCREFATMQSMGMTNRQLKRMVTLEGIFYVLGAAMLGLLVSALAGVTIVQSYCTTLWYFQFRLTLLPAMGVSILLLIISTIVPGIVLKLFNKGSIVERLRIVE